MIKDLVSVIIPTYNDEAYLRPCLDDMVNQTYNDIEVIIINDGSTDNTESILKEYCETYENFKYYNKKNSLQTDLDSFGTVLVSKFYNFS